MGKNSKLRKVVEESKKKVKGTIPVDRSYLNDHLLFSWKYLCLNDCDFSYDRQERKYFDKLIRRFHSISTMTIGELLCGKGNKDSLRLHKIVFSETSRKQGFGLPNSVIKGEPYQFEVSQSEHGRVHGFFSGNTFYLVWLDPHHNLYS